MSHSNEPESRPPTQVCDSTSARRTHFGETSVDCRLKIGLLFALFAPGLCAQEFLGKVMLGAADSAPPLANATVTMEAYGLIRTTDVNGLFRMPLPRGVRPGQEVVLTVRFKEDYVILSPLNGKVRVPEGSGEVTRLYVISRRQSPIIEADVLARVAREPARLRPGELAKLSADLGVAVAEFSRALEKMAATQSQPTSRDKGTIVTFARAFAQWWLFEFAASQGTQVVRPRVDQMATEVQTYAKELNLTLPTLKALVAAWPDAAKQTSVMQGILNQLAGEGESNAFRAGTVLASMGLVLLKYKLGSADPQPELVSYADARQKLRLILLGSGLSSLSQGVPSPGPKRYPAPRVDSDVTTDEDVMEFDRFFQNVVGGYRTLSSDRK